jgi:hypothetical protein
MDEAVDAGVAGQIATRAESRDDDETLGSRQRRQGWDYIYWSSNSPSSKSSVRPCMLSASKPSEGLCVLRSKHCGVG